MRSFLFNYSVNSIEGAENTYFLAYHSFIICFSIEQIDLIKYISCENCRNRTPAYNISCQVTMHFNFKLDGLGSGIHTDTQSCTHIRRDLERDI